MPAKKNLFFRKSCNQSQPAKKSRSQTPILSSDTPAIVKENPPDFPPYFLLHFEGKLCRCKTPPDKLSPFFFFRPSLFSLLSLLGNCSFHAISRLTKRAFSLSLFLSLSLSPQNLPGNESSCAKRFLSRNNWNVALNPRWIFPLSLLFFLLSHYFKEKNIIGY